MREQDIYYSSYKPAQPFDVPQREGNKKLTNKLYDLVKHFKYPFSYPQLQSDPPFPRNASPVTDT
ncbi:unnamed protein product [Malus baccata var. baccata]